MIFIIILSEKLSKSNRFFTIYLISSNLCYNRCINRYKGGLLLPQDELQSHLDKGRYGTPLVNPDEQHKYLGTFRERCYVSMTIGEMKKAENQANFTKELEKYPDEQILLNGSMPEDLQARYIQLATKQKVRFTVINDFVKNDDDSLGLILAAKEAVNEPVIDIEKKYPKVQEPEQSEKPKKSLWDKLFH